jgi:hypothetical protein
MTTTATVVTTAMTSDTSGLAPSEAADDIEVCACAVKPSSISSVTAADPVLQYRKGNMTVSQKPNSSAERRLAIARRLYSALLAQDPDRAITLCDASGRVIASHDPPPRQDEPQVYS